MSTIRAIFKFIIVLIISSSLYAKDDTCKKIYQDCFNNVPKNIITYYKDMDTYGVVNTNNINFRDIPLIASNNSLIIKKIKKNERIQIRKVFFLPPPQTKYFIGLILLPLECSIPLAIR